MDSRMIMKSNRLIKTFLGYVGAIVACSLILIWVIRLWRADLHVLFAYGGDAFPVATLVKGLIHNGWYLNNPMIGMPNGLHLYDFPIPIALHFLILKFISFFTPDYALTMNVYFLVGFPLATLSSFFVFRHFRFPYSLCLLGSLLFAFLPYHFHRGEVHYYLSAYYLVPLAVLICLWISSRDRPLFAAEDGKFRLSLRDPRSSFSIIVCLLTSASTSSYAFFTCYFFLISGLRGILKKGRLQPLFAAIILVTTIVIGGLGQLAPSIINNLQYGKNLLVAHRAPEGAEIYGMKISHLLLPITGHRIGFFSLVRSFYNKITPLNNENQFASLGILGSLGFLILIAWLLRPSTRIVVKGTPTSVREDLLSDLSILNIFAVLLATIGGFGSLLAFAVLPQIRGYNRISIYIAFLSLFALLVVFNWCAEHMGKSSFRRLLFAMFFCFLALAGVMDQTSDSFIPPYARIKQRYSADRRFFSEIEKSLPKGAMIFQLPYVGFPEEPPVNRMPDFDHFRAYLSSTSLRWSYGAMKGSASDLWQQDVAALPPHDLVRKLAIAGFSGIYVNRAGYADGGKNIEAELNSLLNEPAEISADQQLLFFDIRPVANELKKQYDTSQWAKMQDAAIHPLAVLWRGGFIRPEDSSDQNWWWCNRKGVLVLSNSSSEPKRVRIEMTFASQNDESDLKITSSFFSEELRIDHDGTSFSKTFDVPPGRHPIDFLIDAPRISILRNLSALRFRVTNFQYFCK